MPAALALPLEAPAPLCRRHHVRRLAPFGFALTSQFGSDSDVDLLVEFEPGHTPGLNVARLQRELAQLLGRAVDLHTYRGLRRYFRDEAASTTRVPYEQ